MKRKLASRQTWTRLFLIVWLAMDVAAASGGQHWGIYVQGHTPAYVPHNSEYGFNQPRWRRWPDSWTDDAVYKEVKPVETQKKQPAKPAAESAAPDTGGDEDFPPLPPVRPNTPPVQLPEGAVDPDADLQPVPPGDLRPAAPPGLTAPETDEPAAPPDSSNALPPADSDLEPMPELAPLEEPTESVEPTTPPDSTPVPAPGSKLPAPPTELPSVLPGATNRDSLPVQAGTRRPSARREHASEAVFHGDQARTARRPANDRYAAPVAQEPRSLETLPDQPPEELGSQPGDLQLIQPGTPNRPSSRDGSRVVRPVHVATRIANVPAEQIRVREVAAPQPRRAASSVAQVSHQEAVPTEDSLQADEPQARLMGKPRKSPAQANSRLRANPLREAADGGYADNDGSARSNPLRP